MSGFLRDTSREPVRRLRQETDRAGSIHVRAGAVVRTPRLSVVAPAFNERDNVEPLYERVRDALDPVCAWELVLVDDGSVDGTAEAIRRLARRDTRVVGVYLKRNCGQTAATAAGLGRALGDLIATIDADLQNDPYDLPGMLARIDACDAVVGYRTRRHDGFVRRASSRVANGVRNRVTGDSIRDTGCSLKVFRAEAIRSVPLFEGMHRFLPTLLRYRGYAVVEHPVGHHPRVHGESKYGIGNRAWKAFKDLLVVRWMRDGMIRYDLRDAADDD
jgi:glycosyltransferase involved in cell wall biosynthesis